MSTSQKHWFLSPITIGVSLLLTSGCPGTAIADYVAQLPRVIVTASSGGGAYSYPYYSLGGGGSGTLPMPESDEPYLEPGADPFWDEILEANAAQDVRCVNTVSATTKATVSTTDGDSRWMAATDQFNQTKRMLAIANGLRNMPASTFTNFASNRKAFEVTYADGGKEMWMIELNYLYSSTSLMPQPLPGSLLVGTGKPEPAICTV